MLEPAEGPVHFIGVGGAGMSPLAEVLLARGFEVSGSDLRPSPITQALADHGARIRTGPHDSASINGAALVVYSTAIRAANPELAAARERGLRVLHRSELLGMLLEGKRAIAVAGTHGKTTTTGMIAVCLAHAGLDPTALVGGHVRDLGGHYRVGEGELIVLEACESDGSFLNYPDCSQVITSLEPDHLDQHGTFAQLQDCFRRFITSGASEGFLIYCGDTPLLSELAAEAPGHAVSYGTHEGVDFRLRELQTDLHSCAFTLRSRGEEVRVTLAIPGRHNALNAAAAFIAAREVGVPATTACEALAGFRGVGRRFEILWEGDGMAIVDDYAHHPTEIEATLSAIRGAWDGRIIAVFQPHLFSRTRHLKEAFARAFSDADEVILTEIYAAREDPEPGVTGQSLLDAMADAAPDKPVTLVRTKEDVVAHLLPRLQQGDLVAVMGAGDIRHAAEQLTALLGAQPGAERPQR